MRTLAKRLDDLLSDGTPRTLVRISLDLARSKPEVRGAIYAHRTSRKPDGTLRFPKPLISKQYSKGGDFYYTTDASLTDVADYQDDRGWDTLTRLQTQLDLATKALAQTVAGSPEWTRALAVRDRFVAWEASVRAALPARRR